MIRQALILLSLSVFLGSVRQFFPQGLSWKNNWPTQSSSAEEAYFLIAKEADPEFISLFEMEKIYKDKGTTLLDARSSDEYKEGHIPGARNLPYYDLEAHQTKALQGLTKDSLIVIYCEGVGCELSLFLGREMQTGGFNNVKIFYGGYPEWIRAGLPVEKSADSPIKK